VHGDLYLAPDYSEVPANRLLPQIVHQVITFAQGAKAAINLEMSIADLDVTPAQAAPLGLLLAEAVAHARNQVSAGDGPQLVSVTMNRAGPDHASLVVAHSAAPPALADHGQPANTGLGRQLIHAFAAQLHGEVRFSESAESQRMELRFPVGGNDRWRQCASA
jgi:two-component sensor histidine kinase